jgi:hypothetical protein
MDDVKSRVKILEEEGWSQKFVASEPRLSEAVEIYEEAGLEVHLEPLSKEPQCDTCVGDEEKDGCRVCYEGVEDQYRIIFTRPKKGRDHEEDDLF